MIQLFGLGMIIGFLALYLKRERRESNELRAQLLSTERELLERTDALIATLHLHADAMRLLARKAGWKPKEPPHVGN